MTLRKPDVRFGKPDEKASGFRTSEDHSLSPDFRQRQLPERSKSGQYCPVIGRLVPIGRLKSGRCTTPRTFKIRMIRNPDAFSSGLPNQTSGFRTFTVSTTYELIIWAEIHFSLQVEFFFGNVPVYNKYSRVLGLVNLTPVR